MHKTYSNSKITVISACAGRVVLLCDFHPEYNLIVKWLLMCRSAEIQRASPNLLGSVLPRSVYKVILVDQLFLWYTDVGQCGSEPSQISFITHI